MPPFPLDISHLFTSFGENLIYLIIGIGFGYALEISGFAISTKLANQFYFKDMTVLKVMFTAIVVAMVLVFGAAGLGLLDFNLVWVPPTYLWPGIVGGLVMGVGFIVGGFCPGTSLVSLSTFKIDGAFFALGTLIGIFVFGETVDTYAVWWNSSYFGRLTLMDWLGLGTGVVVLAVVLMALFMFWGAEQLERIFGGKDPKQAPRWRYAAAGALLLGAVAVLVIGQPTTQERWTSLEPTKGALLAERQVQIHPGELLATMSDRSLNLKMLDVRGEAEYNLFHLEDAALVPLEDIPQQVDTLLQEPANTVIVLMSNDEERATEAWKTLTAESVPNVYILEGGINNWLDTFAAEDSQLQRISASKADLLRYTFPAALGDRYPAATPDPEEYELEYTPKIKLDVKRGPGGGGCG
jgi:rhodanese-related sulfurtransferase